MRTTTDSSIGNVRFEEDKPQGGLKAILGQNSPPLTRISSPFTAQVVPRESNFQEERRERLHSTHYLAVLDTYTRKIGFFGRVLGLFRVLTSIFASLRRVEESVLALVGESEARKENQELRCVIEHLQQQQRVEAAMHQQRYADLAFRHQGLLDVLTLVEEQESLPILAKIVGGEFKDGVGGLPERLRHVDDAVRTALKKDKELRPQPPKEEQPAIAPEQAQAVARTKRPRREPGAAQQEPQASAQE